MVLGAACALALHEGGHLLAMKLCGMQECTVELTPFGGMMDERRFESYSFWKQIIGAGSGVAASALGAYGCMIFPVQNGFINAFFRCNLSLAFLNALPLWPLDGARVMTALASCAGFEYAAKKLFIYLTMITGATFVLMGLYGIWKGMLNISLLAAGPYLCYAAKAEKVSSKVRRFESMANRLSGKEAVPVSLWAGNEKEISDRFAAQLGRSAEGKYQVLLAIDPSSGKIQKCWTEQEMMHYLMSMERIDGWKT